MITIKRHIYACVATGLALAIFFSGCHTGSNSEADAPPPQIEFKQPVVQPLLFSRPQHINWAKVKTTVAIPVVEKFDLNKLPARPYDSASVKPFPKNDSLISFNYHPNQERDFNIDKLPSIPLVFKNTILPPPKHLRVGPMRFKGVGDVPIFEFGDPLQGATVTNLLTDREGFVWIASIRGVFRYDGEDLCQYIAGPLDYNVFNMVEDKLGCIWISSFNQVLQIIDPRAGTLKKLTKAQGLTSNSPLRLLVDKHERIWITGGQSGGVDIVDQQAGVIKFLDKKNGLADSSAIGMTQDKGGRIWISGSKGINVVDVENKSIKLLNQANSPKLDTLVNLGLFCDRNGNIWMAMNNGIVNVLNAQQTALQRIDEVKASKSNIFNFSQDDKGRVWICTQNNGAEIVDLRNHTLQTLKKENGLNSDVIISTLQDGKGQQWIATLGGLNMIPTKGFVKEQIGKTPTGTLFEDGRGLIWQAGTAGGMDILDRIKKTARHLSVREGLSNDSIQNIRQFDDKIFICTNSGVDIIDSAKQTISHLSIRQGLHSKGVYTAIEDSRGRIWMGGAANGLDVFDPKKDSLKFIDKLAGLTNINFTDLLKDKQGTLWVSSQFGGIITIDPNRGIIKHIKGVTDLDGAVSKIFMQDEWGNIWIGTHHGIYIADVRHHTLTSFSSAQGLIDETVISLLRYKHRIYAGTFKGITEITPPAGGNTVDKPWGVKWFGINYGITKINTTSYLTDLITRDGLYWWGDVGATVLDLSKKDTAQSVPYIAGMRVMDQQEAFVDQNLFKADGKDTLFGQGSTYYLKGQTPQNTGYSVQENLRWDSIDGPYNMPVNLQLPHNQNYIQFEYTALNLDKRDTTWYRYKLTGEDDEWSAPTPMPFSRNYYNLRRGQYTFEVSVKNKNGTWSRPAELDFTINPPWWVSLWACIVYVFLLAGIVYAFVYYRSLQLLQEKKVLENKVQLRTEEVMQQKEELEAQRDELEKAFSDLKLTQSQLVQSEKMASLGELTAGIAHEIQNPLNFVNNFAEVTVELIAELKEETLSHLPPEVKEEAEEIIAGITENLQKVSHHGKRADAIVKAMLQHSRTGSGQREPTNINALADEYLRLAYHGLRAKDKTFNAHIAANLDSNIGEIKINSQEIGRVLLNLLNNAFYAVNEKQKTQPPNYKPAVEISTTLINIPHAGGSRRVEISVKDNGGGIPKKILDKIFQPFFTTKPTGQGTGLGLSMSYDIIKANGGDLKVDTTEGEFTIFSIQLPI